MSTSAQDTGGATGGVDRRTALRHGALVGGTLAWSIPVVQHLATTPAAAQAVSPVPQQPRPPAPKPDEPVKDKDAPSSPAPAEAAGEPSGGLAQTGASVVGGVVAGGALLAGGAAAVHLARSAKGKTPESDAT